MQTLPPKSAFAWLGLGGVLLVLTKVINDAAENLVKSQLAILHNAQRLETTSPETAVVLSSQAQSLIAWVSPLLDLAIAMNLAGLGAGFIGIGITVIEYVRAKRREDSPDLGGQIKQLMNAVEQLGEKEARSTEVLAKVQEEKKKMRVLIDMHPEQWAALDEHGRPARLESRWIGIAGIAIGVPGLIVLVWQNFERIARVLP